MEPRKEQHGSLWSLVFRDSAWITKVANVYHGAPTLLGASIEDFYNNDHLPPSLFSETPIWVLLLGIPDLRFKAEEGLFWRCLQPHTYYEEASEVKLDSGIVLNVSDVVGGVTFIGYKVPLMVIILSILLQHRSNLLLS